MAVVDKNKVLKSFRRMLDRDFPSEIQQLILFDPKVLGKSAKRTDVDLLVVLKKNYNWEIEDKILALGYELDLEFDIITDIKVISLQELRGIKGSQVYILEARKNGLVG